MRSILAFVFLLLTLPGWAQPVAWQAVVQRVSSCNDYRVKCRFKTPSADLSTDYLANTRKKVAVKVLPGSSENVGAVSFYEESAQKVLIKYPAGGVVARPLAHESVSDRLYHRFLFEEFVQTAQNPVGQPADTGKTHFHWQNGGRITDVWVNSSAEIVRVEVHEGKTLVEAIEFSGHRWNTGTDPSSFLRS